MFPENLIRIEWEYYGVICGCSSGLFLVQVCKDSGEGGVGVGRSGDGGGVWGVCVWGGGGVNLDGGQGCEASFSRVEGDGWLDITPSQLLHRQVEIFSEEVSVLHLCAI